MTTIGIPRGYPLANPFKERRYVANAQTIQSVINQCVAGDTVLAEPGEYVETITIARSLSNLTIIALGGRGAAFVNPSVEDAGGLICHADDVTIMGLGIAAEDESSAAALTVSGSRFRAIGCKIEGGLNQVVIGPGTIAQEAAGTHGVGADWLFDDCEFCWGTNGIVMTCTDYGAVTQGRIARSLFHNLTGKHITEAVGSGGSAAVAFQNIWILDNLFSPTDAGVDPTNYIDLNGNNANTGIVARCTFPVALNSGLNLVSTAVKWVDNRHPAGISNGQPS